MKRLYLATRLQVYLLFFVLLNVVALVCVYATDSYPHWIWIFPLATLGLALLINQHMKMPFRVMKRTEEVLEEMLEGQFTSRLTEVPWMGEAGHIAWDLNETLDQLETFFREVKTSFELVSQGRYYRRTLPVGLHGELAKTLERINSSLDAMAENAIYIKRNEMAAQLQALNTGQTMSNLLLSQNDLTQ